VKRYLVSFVLGLASVLALMPISSMGQTSTAAPYTPPRTADGHPDLQGVWQAMNTAAEDLEAHNGRLGVPAGQGVVEGTVIPYKPEALAKRKENFEKRDTLDPENQCLLPGVPRITYTPGPFQIVQQADKILVMYEYRNAIRYIYMNGNPHPKGPIDWWMGDSRGRWDGNTLVVDVVHFNDQTWFDRAGNFHSEDLHVVERYTPTSPYHMQYEVTIEDPKTFTRPWKISMPLYRRQEKDVEVLEYACSAYLLEREWANPTSTYFK
jgi:hypothetical protein